MLLARIELAPSIQDRRGEEVPVGKFAHSFAGAKGTLVVVVVGGMRGYPGVSLGRSFLSLYHRVNLPVQLTVKRHIGK